MSKDLKNRILDSISNLKNELQKTNDAAGVSKEIYVSQLSRGRKAINDANNSTSIDERINLLVVGLNEVIDISGNKSETVLRQIQNLKLQIDTLEDQLKDDLKQDGLDESANDELSDEEKKN